jgi:hypothetical protein
VRSKVTRADLILACYGKFKHFSTDQCITARELAVKLDIREQAACRYLLRHLLLCLFLRLVNSQSFLSFLLNEISLTNGV